MKKFETREDLINERAKMNHEANLRDGGIFDKDLNKISDLQNESILAIREVKFLSESYVKFEDVPTDKACYYIKGFGYAEQ